MARILVVDDEYQVRKMLNIYLTRAGYEVDEAADGRLALVYLESTTPDLVITDIYMPVQEGLETILRIRKTKPDLKIIALSGGGQTISGGGESMRENALITAEVLGAAYSFTKPVNNEDLLKAVKELIG